jgi:hypothetical protein
MQAKKKLKNNENNLKNKHFGAILNEIHYGQSFSAVHPIIVPMPEKFQNGC